MTTAETNGTVGGGVSDAVSGGATATATALAKPGPTANTVLSATGVTVRFGGLVALSEVSLQVPPSSIIGLVGPNGAGKSTLFAVLSGLLPPASGRVYLGGADVTRSSPQARARKGMARTFQQPELFLGLTVREHLVLAHRVRFARKRLWQDMANPLALLPAPASENDRVDALLELLDLTRVAKAPVAALPLGTSRLVEVGRALATQPDVVLLDEPLSGLDMHESENLASAFRRVVDEGERQVSLLMVEHDVATVLALSSHIYVLDFGELIAEGSPEAVRNNAAVRSAYLGDENVTAARTDLEPTAPEPTDREPTAPDDRAPDDRAPDDRAPDDRAQGSDEP